MSQTYKISMQVKYFKTIDQEFFDEVNQMGKELSPIFGFDFPKLIFKDRVVPVARAIAKAVILDEKRLRTLMKKIYGSEMPDITIFINTTSFSTWNLEKKYISISCFRFGKFFETVCHESNHLMYDLIFKTQKYQDNSTKETVTVLNNILGVEDKGWDKFFEKRKKVLKYYHRSKDFLKTIKYARSICE